MSFNEQVRERINIILAQKHVSVNKVCNNDPSLSRKLSRQVYGTTEINLSTIEALLTAIPNISCEWLFTGTGTPFKDMTMEQRLASLEERLSAMEGERENNLPEANLRTA